MHPNLRRLQARRSSRDISTDRERARGLQSRSAAPRFGVQSQLPASRGNLLDPAGDTGERERQLLVGNLEIDAAVFDVDAVQPIRGGDQCRAIRARAGFRGRQPTLQIPASLRIANQNQARTSQRQHAKFKVAAQEARPSQPSRQMIGAQEIFISKRRIFADGYAVGVQLRAWQQHQVEVDDLDGSPKRARQMTRQKTVHPARVRQRRDAGLRNHDEGQDTQRRLPPCTQPVHVTESFAECSSNRK